MGVAEPFTMRHRGVHVIAPRLRRQERRRRQRNVAAAVLPLRQTGPRPVLGARDQARRSSVALHVARHRDERTEVVESRRRESSLIHRSLALCPAMSMPARRVGRCDPLNELRESLLPQRSYQQMPVVPQDAVGNQRRLMANDSCPQYGQKRSVITGLREQRLLSDAAVDDMIEAGQGRGAWATGHGRLDVDVHDAAPSASAMPDVRGDLFR